MARAPSAAMINADEAPLRHDFSASGQSGTDEHEPAGATATWRFGTTTISLLEGHSPERRRLEQAVLQSGRALALPHRSAWGPLERSASGSWFLFVSDSSDGSCGAVALQLSPSRALPGHLIVRCERFGPGVAVRARKAVLQALVALVRQRRRVLRLSIETFAIDPVERAELEAHMRGLGFDRVGNARCYEHTLLVSLAPDEEAIFAALHRTARRHVRAVGKNPVEIRIIDDPACFDRLDELSRETYGRTGGSYDPPDWSKVVALSAQEPSASRLVGLFRTDIDGPASLLAFAWGCGHGDHVHYSRAASTRNTDLRMPLMYPVVWDLICWGKRNGARHFDFGGITSGGHETDDPLGGISDFKRYFSEHAEQVGAEWSLEPRAVQAQAASVVTALSSVASRVMARSRESVSKGVRLVSRVTVAGPGSRGSTSREFASPVTPSR